MIPMVDERVPIRGHDVTVVLSYPDQGTVSFGVVLFPPHPDLGGSRDHPLLVVVAQAIVAAGGAALRYQYAMPENHETVKDGPVLGESVFPSLLQPWPMALETMTNAIGAKSPLYAFGYSLGTCVMAHLPGPPPWRRPVFVAPPLGKQPQVPLGAKGRDALVLLGDADFTCQQGDVETWLTATDTTHEEAQHKGVLRILSGNDHFLRGEEDHIARMSINHWQTQESIS